MDRRIEEFVHLALKPKAWVSGGIAEPGFVLDSEIWHRAFLVAERLGCRTAFFAAIAAQTWYPVLPERIKAMVDERIQRARLWSAILDNEMEYCANAISEARVPAMETNGLSLIHRYYPDSVFRPVARLELQIHPEDQLPALATLGKFGYREVMRGKGWIDLSRRKGAPAVRIRVGGKSGRESAKESSRWARSRIHSDAMVSDYGVRSLGVEDMIVQLIKESWSVERLRSPRLINDLNQILHAESGVIDWEYLLTALESEGLVLVGWIAFTLLVEQWGMKSLLTTDGMRRLTQKAGPLRRALLNRVISGGDWFSPSGASRVNQLQRTLLIGKAPQESIPEGLPILHDLDRAA